MKVGRSLFWKIFLTFWVTNLLLLMAGSFLIRGEYRLLYGDLADNTRIRTLAEYLVSNYESGVDTNQFRLPGQTRFTPRLLIQDLDTGLIVAGQRFIDEENFSDHYWDYISPSSGRYRIFVEDNLFELDEPDFPWPLATLALVINAVFSWLLTLFITGPILRLRGHVENLAENLSAPLEPKLLERSDEFGELARSVDEMSHRIRSLIESKQELFYSVSHELRAPLARMQVASQILMDRAQDREEDLKPYERVDREIISLDQLISELLSYIKEDYSKFTNEKTDVRALLEEVVSDQDFASSTREINLAIDADVQSEVYTKPTLLERALKNLLENAIKYSPENSPVEIHLSEVEDRLEFCLLDSGPGIPEEKLETVLQPFTRLHSESIEGVGLGLSIVLRAAQELRGELELVNREEGGLRACLKIPK